MEGGRKRQSGRLTWMLARQADNKGSKHAMGVRRVHMRPGIVASVIQIELVLFGMDAR